MTSTACRTRGCSRPIPVRQTFCRACLEKLPHEVKHAIQFATSEVRLEAIKKADKILSGISESIRPGSAIERFRSARAKLAEATKILERKR